MIKNVNDIIEVTEGKIIGKQDDQYQDVVVYKAIPYAAPPISDNRWKAPQPVINWEAVKQCNKWGYSAIQVKQAPFMMWTKEFIIEDTGYSEDCLTLNVWTKISEKQNRPVIVYIHGGGFTSGGSSCKVYDGAYLASQDVVYVSINYRVGIFGFLTTNELNQENEHHVSGNYGILDMIQALKWVKENITQFGGDPSNVTIMGQSAGSSAVHALILSPLAKGLFHKAVAESFNPLQLPFKTIQQSIHDLSKHFDNKSITQLRDMDANAIMQYLEENGLSNQMGFAPVIDGYVLPKSYDQACKEGDVNPVQLMTGFVTGDILLFSLIRPNMMGIYEKEEVENQAKALFGDQINLFYQLYPIDDDIQKVMSQFNIDVSQVFIDQLATIRKIENADTKTYSYYFTHVMPGENSDNFGAFHTADVPYFLGILCDERKEYWEKEDEILAQNMSQYLISFARTGQPDSSWMENLNGETMILDTDIKYFVLSEEKKKLFQNMK